MYIPETFDPAVTRSRRDAFMARVDAPVVLDAGTPPPRNYAANRYPFRAGSHFLYFAGVAMPGGRLWLGDGQARLYRPELPPDDALWHGPQPDDAELSARLGLPVLPLTTLPAGGRSAHDPQVADALVAQRLVHDAAAIAELERAAAATVIAHRAGMRATRPGLREWAVRAEMEAALARAGMGTAYTSIVTARGEVLHNHDDHHVLADGDLLLVDLGAETRGGWAADVTRTWPVSGRFSPTQRAVYEVVRGAQQVAIDAVRPGVRYRDVHLAACRAIAAGLVALGILRGDVDELVADDVHALFFPHGVGHLLGLDVHDMEDLGDRAGYAPGRARSDRFGLGYLRLDRDLAAGMAVTIEPGIYFVPAILDDPTRTAKAGDRLDRAALTRFADVRGIRIEDDVLVTETGARVLTGDLPKAPDAVEAEVGQCVG